MKFKPIGPALRAYRSGYQASSNNEPRKNPYIYVSQKRGETSAWWETGYDKGTIDRENHSLDNNL